MNTTLAIVASPVCLALATATLPGPPCQPPHQPRGYFGALRPVPGAQGPIPLLPLASADVNGDGTIDFFGDFGIAEQYYVNGEPFCCRPDVVFEVLALSSITGAGSPAEHQWCAMLDNTVAWGLPETWIAANYPDVRDGYALGIGEPVSPYTGWRDCDLDGDLDLVITVRIVRMNGSTNTVPLYFENIGFERSGTLSADLTGDGSVNAKDLATLLAQWTGG